MCPSDFGEPWWREVVASGFWSTVELQESYRAYAEMPSLAQCLGPCPELPDTMYAKRLAIQNDCMTA